MCGDVAPPLTHFTVSPEDHKVLIVDCRPRANAMVSVVVVVVVVVVVCGCGGGGFILFGVCVWL